LVQRHKKSPLSKTYSWFFSDIIASSDPAIYTKEQLEKIKKLNELLSKTKILSVKDDDRIVVPTGDGYMVGFLGSAEEPLILAIDLLTQIEKNNEGKRGKDKLNVRIGIDEGPVYTIDDINNQKIFWGPGIITAKRVMDLAKENQIFASHRIVEYTQKLSKEYKKLFHKIGEYEIKHGEKIKIYNIYGDGFGNKSAPRKSKIIRRQETEEDLRAFEFRNIDIILDVIDPQTMLTHHTYIWDVTNVAPQPRSRIFYYLGGDTPKEFSEINVKVTDMEGEKLKIAKVDVDKPYYKEFFVQLKKPVKTNQRLNRLKLEFDWEEPDRYFEYKLATHCNKFTYKFSIKSGLAKQIKVLKVDRELGYKKDVDDPAPDIKYEKRRTTVFWEGKDLKANSAYRLVW